MKTEKLKVFALTGRHDLLSDGVWDFCTRLSSALPLHGADLELCEVAWEKNGWLEALRNLWNQFSGKRNEWALLQYTAMAWSRRGFPFGALAIAWLAKHRGAHLAIVFHEPSGFRADGIWAQFRFFCQQWVIHRLYSIAEVGIFTVPLATLPWVHPHDSKARFIPIGANIPEMLTPRQPRAPSADSPKIVAVFCVTTVRRTAWEVAEIAAAIRHAKQSVPHLRLVVFGRGANEARILFEDALCGSGVDLSVLGVIPASEITKILSEADAFLYVRDTLKLQHGSTLAAVACGLPLVAYGEGAACFPLSEAGILLAQPGDQNALCSALERVLTDSATWSSLHQRSVNVYKEYFTWEEIGRKYADVLHAPVSMFLDSPMEKTPQIRGVSRLSSHATKGAVKKGMTF
ncbi:MAG TPA: glycosyltransferase [Candidatus Acidoferrales bacterium]|nr:glycosyltransferase [Candidatus Acidoferrales bacterium]